MRRITLFIATSLDGFIARENGKVDWLFTDQDYGYNEFYNSVDTTLMGGATYRQILTFGQFPYPDKQNYIFSRSTGKSERDFIQFIQTDPIAFTKSLRKQEGGDIWLIGGGQINTILMNEGLVDGLIISVHPVLLGYGIPLFHKLYKAHNLKLVKNLPFETGLTQLHYRVA